MGKIRTLNQRSGESITSIIIWLIAVPLVSKTKVKFQVLIDKIRKLNQRSKGLKTSITIGLMAVPLARN